MSTYKRLGLLLVILIIIAFSSSFLSDLKSVDWSKVFPNFGNVGKTIETQKVINEDSAVIDVVNKVSPSVVSVLEKSVSFDVLSGPSLSENSIGTGFAVEPNLIITNKHVVSNMTAAYTVVTNKDQKLNVVKIYRDPTNDLAILQVDGGSLPTVSFGDSDSVKVGQTVLAFGNALGRFSNTVTRGIISGIGRGITASEGLFGPSESLDNVLQTDAALNPGNSGGPLVNLAGQVIGVDVAISQSGQNIGFAIPSNKVSELLMNFKQNKKIVKPFLGVTYFMLTPSVASDRNLVPGAFVSEVAEGSGAADGGVKANDIITQVDGNDLSSTNTLSKVVSSHKVGDKITLTIWRNGTTTKPTVTLKEAPSS